MHRLFLVTLLILALPTADAEARRDTFVWDSITAADWAVDSTERAAAHSAIMLFEKVVLDEEDLMNEKVEATFYRRIRVLNAEGRREGDVNVPLHEPDQKVKAVRGRVVLPDGR